MEGWFFSPESVPTTDIYLCCLLVRAIEQYSLCFESFQDYGLRFVIVLFL